MQSTNNDHRKPRRVRVGKRARRAQQHRQRFSGVSSQHLPETTDLSNLQEKPASFGAGIVKGVATFQSGRSVVTLLAPGVQSRGGSSMPNISVWPNDARVCLLSQVLETDSTPARYYLSAKACAGILRRAESRGNTLPEAAGSGAPSTHRMRGFGDYATDSKSGALHVGGDNDAVLVAERTNEGALDTQCGYEKAAFQSVAAGHVIPITDKATRYAGQTGRGSGNGLAYAKPGDPSPTLTAGDKARCILRHV